MWAVDFQFNDTTVGRYAAIPARLSWPCAMFSADVDVG
jgi:hypothetical protein